MKTLTITSDDEQALEQVKKLADKLKITVRESTTTPGKDEESSGKKLTRLLEKWHKKGGLMTSIEDPVAWQREQRKDRKLPFRD